MIPTFQELRKVFRSKLWQATFWPTFAMINHSLPVQCGAFALADICGEPRITVASNSLICVAHAVIANGHMASGNKLLRGSLWYFKLQTWKTLATWA